LGWIERLGKDTRGSRPRCVLLTDGDSAGVAERLTRLVDHPDVLISPDDVWMPRGKRAVREARLEKELTPPAVREQLLDWWLVHRRGANTPNWDIASTCRISGRPGLLLVEAKAHEAELSLSGKSAPGSSNSRENHHRIGLAIDEAGKALEAATGKSWGLSRDTHYQLSNRFAWSWKLASLRIPVVLVYLGFLNAEDMTGDGPLFRSPVAVENLLKRHGSSIVDEACWGDRLDIDGTPLIPLIRAVDQPFASGH